MALVLTIDDDPALRQAMAKALRLAGHEVLEAEDGQRGLELALLRRPDLVVTDVMMPVMDGVQAIKRIRAARPDLPIIAVSGSETAWAAAQTFGWIGWGNDSLHSPLAQARMEGADVTIGKPFEIGELLEAVELMLERARRRAGGGPEVAPAQLYHVREDRAGRWSIQREGAPFAAARATSCEDALFLARRLASGHRLARVLVHNSDGTIQANYTYGDEA